MNNLIKRIFPPDFSKEITVYKKFGDGFYHVKGSKFEIKESKYSGYINGGADFGFYARIPIAKADVLPGDILVLGRVYDSLEKSLNGENILKKYPHRAFRAKSVSYCGNHILVKG